VNVDHPYEQPFCDWCANGNNMTLLRVALLALAGRPTSPRGYALRAVDRYRRWSAGRSVCPNVASQSCSTLGREAVVRYGALRGTFRAWRVGRTYRSRWLASQR